MRNLGSRKRFSRFQGEPDELDDDSSTSSVYNSTSRITSGAPNFEPSHCKSDRFTLQLYRTVWSLGLLCAPASLALARQTPVPFELSELLPAGRRSH
mmetsp:Transcript_12447/g.29620  ORF Transcript_12447/g.29620 Transcript_12447/m.29620 type:complete len:97 (-) Transcript_12447:418-708(-)